MKDRFPPAPRDTDWCCQSKFVDAIIAARSGQAGCWAGQVVSLFQFAVIGIIISWLVESPPWIWLILPPLGWFGWLGWRSVMGRRVKGWRVVGSGLLRLNWHAPPRLHPWSTLRGVDLCDDRILVQTDSGVLDIPAERVGSEAVLGQLRKGLADDQPAQGHVTRSEMAEWMGLGSEERLYLRDDPTAPWKAAARGLITVAVVALIWTEIADNVPWSLFFVIATGTGIAEWLRARPLMVTPEGMRCGSWQASWDDLKIVRLGRLGWTLDDDRGRTVLRVHPDHRLAAAVERLYEARQAGMALPRMGEVPDHALSRAESAEVSAERGISAAEDRP